MLNSILGKEIAYYTRGDRPLLVYAILLTALSSIFVVIPVYLIQPFVDQGMSGGNDPVTWTIPWITFEDGSFFSWHRTERVIAESISPNRLLIILLIATLISVMLKSITIYFSGLCLAAFSDRAVRALRINLFRKFVSLPLSFYHKRKSGELIARATADLAVMRGSISDIVIGLIQHPLTALVVLIYLLFVNYKLTLAAFILAPIVAGLIRLLGRKAKKHAFRVQDSTAHVTSAYHELFLCLKVIHGFVRGDDELGRFKDHANFLYKRTMRWQRWRLSVSPLMDVAGMLVLPGVLFVGKVYFDHTFGEILAMMYAFNRLYTPIKKLAKLNTKLRTLQGATERVFDIMRTESDIRDLPDARTLPRHHKSIEFKNVSFAFNSEQWVLRDISFKVEAGQLIAFVGSTGAGKSTLLDLICRFYDVTRGEIQIDDQDVRQVTLGSLRSQIGLVSQEINLFHDTILNNISYGNPNASMDKIIEAARAAHAHDFILAQPNGYDTVVGDQGSSLSGGQRQRLAIARALLVDPAILVLDEAASALDAESETCIQNTIERLHGSMTILVVAHRLSTILMADRIYVLEKGRVIEYGTREELMAMNGRFRQLYDLQFRGEAIEA